MREALFADAERVWGEMKDFLERGNPSILATIEFEAEFKDEPYGPLHGHRYDAKRSQYHHW